MSKPTTRTSKAEDQSIKSGHWKKEEETKEGFTANEVLDAWRKGIERGRTEQDRVLKRQFDRNLEKAQKVSEELGKRLEDELDIEFNVIHLKVDSIIRYKSLVVINKEDYYSDRIDDIYELLFEHTEKVNDEDFEIEFVLTYDGENLNRDAIIRDGYVLYHEKEETRAAQ